MTASILPLQMILVAQLWIYLPLSLMIDPSRIKEPDIPQICSQLLSLLPLKIILVIWPPLLVYQISYLLMILILSMLWRDISLTVSGWKEDTASGNTMKKHATKRQGSIAPRALIKTRNFIIVMCFPGLTQRQVLPYWGINILCHNFSVYCCVCLPSILYFTCWTRFVLILFLFYWSLPVISHMSALIENLTLYYFCWLFELMWW